MKFSYDTAQHMLDYLTLPGQISFGKTSKENRKTVQKYLSDPFVVGQILWQSPIWDSSMVQYYKIVKVTKKTVVVQHLVNSKITGPKIRCKKQHGTTQCWGNSKSRGWFKEVSCIWELHNTSKFVFLNSTQIGKA